MVVLVLFTLAAVTLAEETTEVKEAPDSTKADAVADSVKMKAEAVPTAVKVVKDSIQTKKVETMEKVEPPTQTTELGVKFQDLVIGEGSECKTGSKVDCHYTLWFADSTGNKEKRFQSSKDSNRSFQCTLGKGLIKGWSDGMVGMKEGGTRRLILSPDLAYGPGGGGIPANQWLVFEIEFLKLLE